MFQPLEPMRRRAAAEGASLADTIRWPVLVARETIEGDLSFRDPEDFDQPTMPPPLRPGSTLLLSVRVTAGERMRAPRRGDRKPLPEEQFAVLDPGPKGTITVGRSPENDLVLRDPTVSSLHARLHPVPATEWCFVVDLGSRNGTAHNDARTVRNGRAELQSGDEIAFGRHVFVFLTAKDFYRYLVGTLQ